MINKFIDWTERGYVPDSLLRMGIRRLLKKRLAQADAGSPSANASQTESLVEEFDQGPIALVPELANDQHYEVPADLFRLTLGPHRKYSSCFWPAGVNTLEESEKAALKETCTRAELEDGMNILELGCGWGSLSLWMAERYPNAKITVVSNSNSQREHIQRTAVNLGIERNLKVVTCDINDFETDQSFDRIVSVEMFEHVRNHRKLMNRISNWLKPEGKLFVHIFCHRELTYKFQNEGESDWMSRYFFSGGIMPSEALLTRYDEDLELANKWIWNGKHYQKTCEAWHTNMIRNREQIMPILETTYGKKEGVHWFNRWRMFYLSCSELFGYNDGNEWYVAHYLFKNKPTA
tara:strand:+ start:33 stop:1079 length:1047 start_codon:yes stop_codon:yes gene_type:complete